MTVKSFGTILIVVGFFIAFSMFTFSKWGVRLNFIENIRYAKVYEGERKIVNGEWKDAVVITLGQALLFPFFIIGVGVLLNKNIVDSKEVVKLLPFLTPDD